MKLLWEELKFWNKQQMLICRRLNEDHKKYAKYKYLLEVCKKPEEKKLLKFINDLFLEKQWKDRYNKDLIQIKINNIVDELAKPIIGQRKQYYEQYYKQAIIEKRREAQIKLQKKFKRECTLDF